MSSVFVQIFEQFQVQENEHRAWAAKTYQGLLNVIGIFVRFVYDNFEMKVCLKKSLENGSYERTVVLRRKKRRARIDG